MPVDFSPAARAAFYHALTLAAQNRAEVILLHVMMLSERANLDSAVKEAKKKLREFCKDGDGATKRCQPVVRTGIPFFEITQSAEREGADLIVLGRSASDTPLALGDGHTAERVLRYAKCPVLVIRE